MLVTNRSMGQPFFCLRFCAWALLDLDKLLVGLDSRCISTSGHGPFAINTLHPLLGEVKEQQPKKSVLPQQLGTSPNVQTPMNRQLPPQNAFGGGLNNSSPGMQTQPPHQQLLEKGKGKEFASSTKGKGFIKGGASMQEQTLMQVFICALSV